MNKVGTQMIQPEEGWERYDDLDSFVVRTGTVTEYYSNYYKGTTSAIKDSNGKFNFSFTGVGFRIIGDKSLYRNTDIRIKINGVEESFSAYTSTGAEDMICLYEKTGLDANVMYDVEIYCPTATSGSNFYLDAVDIYEGHKMVVKNPITNEYYSLKEKTIIPLSNYSNEKIISHGIEKGVTIILNELFNKVAQISSHGDREEITTTTPYTGYVYKTRISSLIKKIDIVEED